MKKLICLLTACLLLIPASAAPAMNDYRYDDAGLTLSLPQGDEWVILTHDVQEGDPAIDFFDSDLETLQTSMDQNNIRFEAITQDRMCEITIADNEQRAADIAARVRFDQALEKSQDAQQYIDMAIGIGIAVLAALFLLRFYRKKQRQMRLPSVTGTQPQDSDSSSADSADDQPPQQ